MVGVVDVVYVYFGVGCYVDVDYCFELCDVEFVCGDVGCD